jgi:hypothetical protein
MQGRSQGRINVGAPGPDGCRRALPQNAQTMHHLILRPGPELVLRAFRPEPDELGPRPKERNVTDRAHEFLFEAITLHPQATLADVFALMEASPLLKRIYRPSFVDELCAEAIKGPADGEQQPAHDRIEYLELFAEWGLDTHSQTYSGTTRLRLHGVGPVLQEDHPEERKRKGERIEWAVSLTPLRSLLALPVRVNHSVRITEGDQAAQAWMQEIGRAQVEDVTLGQVIEGLLWELSFHGGPAEQEAVAEGLRQQVAELKDGTAKTYSSDEVFERLGLPGCDGLFDEFGGHKPREVDQALRDIGDTENAADWIARKFEGRVVVKPEFRHLNGREFRRARQDLRR